MVEKDLRDEGVLNPEAVYNLTLLRILRAIIFELPHEYRLKYKSYLETLLLVYVNYIYS